ncbi:MAG: Indole-3-glycerol phosphate synthase (EC 4.1.1.48), partial [Olavius algarvensis Gamma 1 endosymbiont]
GRHPGHPQEDPLPQGGGSRGPRRAPPLAAVAPGIGRATAGTRLYQRPGGQAGGRSAGGHRRNQTGIPQQRPAQRRLPAGRDRGRLPARRRRLPLGAHGSGLLPGQRRPPAGGPGRLPPTGPPQGLHHRPLPGLRGPGHRRRLHPAHRGLPGRPPAADPRCPGHGTGTRRTGGGPRPGRTGTGAGDPQSPDRDQQPGPAQLPNQTGDDPRPAGRHPRRPDPHHRERHSLAGRRCPPARTWRPCLPGRGGLHARRGPWGDARPVVRGRKRRL